MSETGGDEKISFHLDLDAQEFIEQIISAKEHVSHLGEADSLRGLVEGFMHVGAAIGVLGVSAYALSKTFEEVLDAEKIKATSAQFDQLSKNSGLFGEELKDSLMKSANGLVTEHDLLVAANKALVELSGGTEHLSEVMDMARKYTLAFGGDLVTNFENINQAVATGNMRMLKHMGIQIDAQKAVRDFAEAHGIAANALSESAKQEARMEAVLAKGNERLKGVNGDLLVNTTLWTQLKVILSEVAEMITMVFDKVMGSSLSKFLTQVKDGADGLHTLLVDKFGDGVDQAKAHNKRLVSEFDSLQAKIEELDKTGEIFFNGTYVKKGTKEAGMAVDEIKAKMAGLQEKLKDSSKELEHFEDKAKESKAAIAGAGSTGGSLVDPEKEKQNKAKHDSEMLKLEQDHIKALDSLNDSTASNAQNLADKIEQIEEQKQVKIAQINQSEHLSSSQKAEERLAIEQATSDKILELRMQEAQANIQAAEEERSQVATEDELAAAQEAQKAAAKEQYRLQAEMLKTQDFEDEQARRQAEIELEQNYNDQVLEIMRVTYDERRAMNDQWVKDADHGADEWAKGFGAASKNAAVDLSNFGAQGQKVFGMFTSHASNAFMQLGEGSKKGSKIMKEAMLGMIADVAQYYGTMMLAAGVFPPNPAALAGGAALLVLSGYLRGQAKGGGGAGGGATGGIQSGGGIGSLDGVGSALPENNMAQDHAQQAKSVHLEVHGNLIESEQANRRITEMVRDALDSTDFSVQRVGS